MKSILNLSILFSLILLGTVHCTPRGSQRNQRINDNSVAVDELIFPQNDSEGSRLNDQVEKLRPIIKEQSQRPVTDIDSDILMTKVILPLAPQFLDYKFLTSPKQKKAKTSTGFYPIPELLSLFNQALLLVGKNHIDLLIDHKILSRYKTLLFFDCDDRFDGNCSMVKYFRSNDSANVVRIGKLIYGLEKDDVQKIQILKILFEVKNRTLDSTLHYLLLERLAVSLSLENAKKISDQRRVQDAQLFANIFGMNLAELNDKTLYKNLVAKLNPWKLSRNDDDPRNIALSGLIRFAAKHLLYEADKKTLSPELNQVNRDLMYQLGPLQEQGYQFQLDNIKGLWESRFGPSNLSKTLSSGPHFSAVHKSLKEEPGNILFNGSSSGILKAMNVDVNFKNDEFQFLVYQLYFGHFGDKEADAFWTFVRKENNRQSLLDTINRMLRLQVVNTIVYTNTRMNQFYRDSSESEIIKLVELAGNESEKIKPIWTTLMSRSQNLINFANRAVVGGTPKEQESLEGLNRMVEELPQNIKYLLSYPSMYPLLYRMASESLSQSFTTSWGLPQYISDLSIINEFFQGKVPPFFDFASDTSILSPTALIYTFYYAIATQIFKSYSNKKVQFTATQFFETVVTKLVVGMQNNLEESLVKFRRRAKNIQDSMSDIQAVCSEERTLQAIESRKLQEFLEENPEPTKDQWTDLLLGWAKNKNHHRSEHTHHTSFSELNKPTAIYGPTSQAKDKVGKKIYDFYAFDSSLAFRKMRQTFTKTKSLVSILATIYNKFYQGEDKQEIESIFKDQFMQSEKLQAEYSKLFFSILEGFDNCEWIFARRDADIRATLFFREYQYLNAIYDQIERVFSEIPNEERNSPTQNTVEKLSQLKDKVNFYIDPESSFYPKSYSESRGHNDISFKSIDLYVMDAFARTRYYYNELFPGNYMITRPPSFQSLSIFEKSKPTTIHFDFSSKNSRANFVSQGLKAYVNFGAMSSVTEPTPIKVLENKFTLLRSLYKLGAIATQTGVHCDGSKKKLPKECKFVSARELIQHHKDYIDLLHISKREQSLLNARNWHVNYDLNKFQSVILKAKVHKNYSYYDLLFKKVFSDRSENETPHVWYQNLLKTFVSEVHNIQNTPFLFPYPKEIEDIYLENYTPWIENHLTNIREFVSEIKDDIQENPLEPFPLVYAINFSPLSIGREDNNVVGNVISSTLMNQFTGFLDTIDRDTSYYFTDTIRAERQKMRTLLLEVSNDDLDGLK